MSFNQQLKNLLKTLDKFTDKEGVLLKQNIKDSAEKFDADLIKLLLNNKSTKVHFFDEIGKATVFNYRTFIDYIDDKKFLLDSYTKFSNKVGLTISNKHIKQIDDVVLSFPFKDCVLEGGQSKDDEKRKEIFFNEILAKDEISRLLDKKVITNAKKYTQNGTSDKVNFNRDENGTIKDNLIIKGNNLLALHTLKSNFAGKVKLIYIDPPYNTGNDSFNYNDNFNHSTWLTFMKNRLEVAKDLLSDDGVIFVQCDDNEQAYLKVLMDDVFGREEFIGQFIWKKKSGGGNDSKHIVSEHESILVFVKKQGNLGEWYELHDEKYLKRYKESDKYGKYFWDTFARPGLKSPINYDIEMPDNTMLNGDWIWSKQRFVKENKKGEIKIQRGKKGWTVFFKQRLNEKGKKTRSLILEKGNSSVGTKEISELFKKRIFATPKPEVLMQHLIYIATKENDIVLDYHLGSGTTCAVAHKMGRQYIGIEQMDYIEDIAVKRMQKVIGKTVKKDGELLESVDFDNGGISKNVQWQGGGEFIYFELDKYNQKYIDNLNAIKAGHSSTKTTLQLFDEIAEQAFLNYDIENKKLLANKKDFMALSLDNQLEFLFSILNKNQLYKNLSEIDDKDLGVDDKTKKLNEDFYG